MVKRVPDTERDPMTILKNIRWSRQNGVKSRDETRDSLKVAEIVALVNIRESLDRLVEEMAKNRHGESAETS